MVVANSREVFSTDVADYAIGLLLDVLWHVSAAERYVQHGSWLVQGDHPLGSKAYVDFLGGHLRWTNLEIRRRKSRGPLHRIDFLCVMSTMVYDKKSKQVAYEVNQGSWYDMQPSNHRLYTDKFLATMAPPTTWRRRLHRQRAFPQFVQIPCHFVFVQLSWRECSIPRTHHDDVHSKKSIIKFL
ncbi:hypothetical protein ZWY2020_040114 [Hordeum vulgare]|nr:hypothetical protein ZWY2020_040114 [Hordeum vulgare]